MEPHTNLRLLFITLCLVISTNSARSRLAPDMSPAPQPIASPTLSPESPSEETVQFSYRSFDPNPEPEESDFLSDNLKLFSSDLHATDVNPEVKKICDQTDHASLCLATVLPIIPTNPDVDSILKVAVQAGSAYAQEALSEAKKLAEKPGTPEDLLSTLNDCQDGYDTAVENFQKTLDAFATNDVGTMRSMLSAVMTFVGDCQDEFAEMQVDSPLSGYAEKLTEMASNCLAISSLKN